MVIPHLPEVCYYLAQKLKFYIFHDCLISQPIDCQDLGWLTEKHSWGLKGLIIVHLFGRSCPWFWREFIEEFFYPSFTAKVISTVTFYIDVLSIKKKCCWIERMARTHFCVLSSKACLLPSLAHSWGIDVFIQLLSGSFWTSSYKFDLVCPKLTGFPEITGSSF